jgi:hypothetical protein
MEWINTPALSIGTFVILFPLAFTWYVSLGGIYVAIKTRKVNNSTSSR